MLNLEMTKIGDHLLTFEEEAHLYQLDGVDIPSVTQVLSLLSDFSFVPPDLLKRASLFGQAVHKAVELYENDDLDFEDLDPAIKPYLDQYIKFKADTGFIATHTEEKVASIIYNYAGQVDLIGNIPVYCGKNNKTGMTLRDIVDLKVTTNLSPVVALQTAAYKEAFEETTGLKIDRRYALQLKKDTYVFQPYDDRSDFKNFIALMHINKWRKDNGFK